MIFVSGTSVRTANKPATKTLNSGRTVVVPHIPEGEDVVVMSAKPMEDALSEIYNGLETLSQINDILRRTPREKDGGSLNQLAYNPGIKDNELPGHLGNITGIEGMHNLADDVNTYIRAALTVLDEACHSRMDKALRGKAMFNRICLLCGVEHERMEKELHEDASSMAV